MFTYPSLQQFVRSPKAMSIAFLWGWCEATFFFVVPDLFFMFTALLAPLYGIIHGSVSVLGSLIGGWIMYQLTWLYPTAMQDFLIHVPLISRKLVAYVQDSLSTGGLEAMFVAPMKGIPYKIYAVSAALLNIKLEQFLFITIPVRLERVLLLSIFAALIGKVFSRHIKNHLEKLVFFYSMAWGTFYLFYAYKMTLEFGEF